MYWFLKNSYVIKVEYSKVYIQWNIKVCTHSIIKKFCSNVYHIKKVVISQHNWLKKGWRTHNITKTFRNITQKYIGKK